MSALDPRIPVPEPVAAPAGTAGAQPDRGTLAPRMADIPLTDAEQREFRDRFDLEKGRHELKNVAPLVGKNNEINREIPTFIRDKQHRDNFSRQRSFMMDDEEQYDIPTFLRKSVD